MPYDAVRTRRLSEVSRLADTLADVVLAADGAPSDRIDALGKAALLLQDYAQPIPDRVAEALIRSHRERPSDAAPAEPAAQPEVLMQEAPSELRNTGRKGFLPRLVSSMRSSRSGMFGTGVELGPRSKQV